MSWRHAVLLGTQPIFPESILASTLPTGSFDPVRSQSAENSKFLAPKGTLYSLVETKAIAQHFCRRFLAGTDSYAVFGLTR
jgi:hypothetical protein